jgi:hypothetical protein
MVLTIGVGVLLTLALFLHFCVTSVRTSEGKISTLKVAYLISTTSAAIGCFCLQMLNSAQIATIEASVWELGAAVNQHAAIINQLIVAFNKLAVLLTQQVV